MLIGPVFHREAAIAPRRWKIYVVRTAYALALLVLTCTAWLVLTGTQLVRDVGDLARFGSALFQILAPLQMALASFFSALLAASAVAHEKDRRTFVLLLLTRLSNCELVLGKLMASLLTVVTMVAAALPIFFLASLFGGISYGQIARATAVTLAAALVCGSLGSTLALWREKTFQALAMTVLALVLWLAVGESVARGTWGETFGSLSARSLAAGISPLRAIFEASRPFPSLEPAFGPLGTSVNVFLLVALAAAVALNGAAVARVRAWNAAGDGERRANFDEREEKAVEQRETAEGVARGQWSAASAKPQVENPESPISSLPSEIIPQQSTSTSDIRHPTSPHSPAPGPVSSRPVWDNPILWREMRTWAYGRKILVVRLAYLALFALAVAGMFHGAVGAEASLARAPIVLVFVPVVLLSLVLVNAQAVTSLTSERDAKALDLLLVTDLTPKEIVYGKLGGVFYNTKEMVLLPLLLGAALWHFGALSFEHSLYLLGGMCVLYVFAATLGLHAGMTCANSGVAVATSLGTLFFLFVGVAVCMRIMMAFSGSFSAQFLPFFAFMVFGGVGLYAVLGLRNPSTAIGAASFLCPIATFYAITCYLTEPPSPLAMFLVVAGAYGFTIAAMLVPAICEFDVATGRASADE